MNFLVVEDEVFAGRFLSGTPLRILLPRHYVSHYVPLPLFVPGIRTIETIARHWLR